LKETRGAACLGNPLNDVPSLTGELAAGNGRYVLAKAPCRALSARWLSVSRSASGSPKRDVRLV
jgi:hypothetical protein